MTDPTRVRLTVAYDGTGFSGFAPNSGVRTVGAELTEAISTSLAEPVSLTCAGRTDRGVHAWGQVITFDTTSARFDPDRLGRSLRSLCGPEIFVRDVAVVPDSFDARFSARWRRYRYTLINDELVAPPMARQAWAVPGPLSLAAMEQSATAFVGHHDFASFCRRPPDREDGTPVSLERTVFAATWHEDSTEEGQRRLVFEIRAGAFCHQMVRSIVGMSVEVGRGRRRASDVITALAAAERRLLPPPAPPSGLCLWDVGYDDDRVAPLRDVDVA